MRLCSIDGCASKHYAKGWCKAHYQAYLRHGSATERPAIGRKRTHGMKHHPLYGTWIAMVNRCTSPTNPGYPNYGGRGITVDAAWVSDPRPFIAWVETNLGARPAGHSLDRIDNERGYEPGNLRWADGSTQNTNRRPFTRASH